MARLLAFSTHVILDCLTVYGTQIFWPLPTPPVMWSTLFIIDPAYSLPLLAGVLAAVIMSRKTTRGHAVNAACLAISTLYILFSIAAKIHVENVARESLGRQGIGHGVLLATPTAFNTLLWRVLAMDNEGYAEGYLFAFGQKPGNPDDALSRQPPLLEGLEDHWPVKRLQWFTHGFYAVQQIGDGIVMTDLRMGMEPDYTFRFRVAAVGNPHLVPEAARRVREPRNTKALAWIWQRIWTVRREIRIQINTAAKAAKNIRNESNPGQLEQQIAGPSRILNHAAPALRPWRSVQEIPQLPG